MQPTWPWILLAPAMVLPQIAPGTEVRLVSLDLLEVYALGRVEDGHLEFRGVVLPVGMTVRVLVFPPGDSAVERAATLAGATALHARVDEEDGVVLIADGSLGTPLRELLARQGIEVSFPGEMAR